MSVVFLLQLNKYVVLGAETYDGLHVCQPVDLLPSVIKTELAAGWILHGAGLRQRGNELLADQHPALGPSVRFRGIRRDG